MCYAVSEHPLSGYRYGGTLVDLGDLYMEDGTNDETRGTNYLGNTHGGMAELNGQWYIFYHRQTNQHSYSRQACAEPLKRTPDGGFQQAEVTSCGLNGGPLDGIGEYEARIACNLWSKHGVVRYDKRFNKKEHPYFTQSGRDGDPAAVQYIANMARRQRMRIQVLPDARRESHSVRRQRGVPRQYRGQRYAGVRDAGGKHPGRSRKEHDERHRAVPYGRWREGVVLPLPGRGGNELLRV